MLKSALAALVLGLAVLPAAAQESAPEIAPGLDRETLRREIRAYLLENPEVIYEAVEILERRRALAQATSEIDLVRSNADALGRDGYSHVAGNPEGAITLVEFFDYRCSYCKRAHADVQTLIRTDPDIRYVMKEFPILGPDSLLASKAAMAGLRQGGDKYERFHNGLMSFGGPLSDVVIDKLAERAGIDVAQMRSDMALPEIEAQIRTTQALAEILRVSGTPTFVIGEKIVRGFVPLDQMTQIVALARTAQD